MRKMLNHGNGVTRQCYLDSLSLSVNLCAQHTVRMKIFHVKSLLTTLKNQVMALKKRAKAKFPSELRLGLSLYQQVERTTNQSK